MSTNLQYMYLDTSR